MVMDPRLTSELTPELRNIVMEIEPQCRTLGLDFFPVIFEMVDYQLVLNHDQQQRRFRVARMDITEECVAGNISR